MATAADALGGEVLRGPDGDRVDLASELHDTIATFDLVFQSEGTYRAYYRARGFNSSSDSIFTPDDFAEDPSDVETLSSDGEFRWERNSTQFVIDSTLTDVPLEFRLALREQEAEIDAFVLSSNLNLSDEELDALFDTVATLPGDYNLDGLVDAADFTLFRDTLGSTQPGSPADHDGNGVVDIDDFAGFTNNFGAGGASAVGSLNTGLLNTAAIPEPSTAWMALSCLVALNYRRRSLNHLSCAESI